MLASIIIIINVISLRIKKNVETWIMNILHDV